MYGEGEERHCGVAAYGEVVCEGVIVAGSCVIVYGVDVGPV